MQQSSIQFNRRPAATATVRSAVQPISAQRPAEPLWQNSTSFAFCVLASGSSGNASILRTPQGCLLIDAGIGPRSLAKRLEGTGCAVGDIKAVILTHLDSDHLAASWSRSALSLGLRLYCHKSIQNHLLSRLGEELAPQVHPFDYQPFSPLAGVHTTAIRLAHDAEGSHGFVLSGYGHKIGYASDLGKVPELLIKAFAQVDLLCLEANYDPQMQLQSARPDYLKQRIMGGRGHLSNQQAFDAVRNILTHRTTLPDHVVLLHRSRQCNCPHKLRRLFESDPRLARRLTLAEQSTRTGWLHPSAARKQP